ncbi:MAG: septum formation initiator family protein [Filifactor alocis]|nr:septum formation initiator family protein [Filifactor alocis]
MKTKQINEAKKNDKVSPKVVILSEKKNREKKKSKKKSTDYLLLTIGAGLVAVLLYIATFYVNQGMTLNRLEKQKKHLEIELEEKNKEIGQLKKELENSQTPEYIEKQAREQLKMVMPGERVYIDLERKQ